MSKRYEKFDILRGFAMMGVVFIHITAPFATDGDLFSIILNQLSRFAVPVFFFLSGWGLTIADSWGRSEGYWDFLKTRLMSLIPQYLIWNIIYLFYADVWNIPATLDVSVLQELLKAFLLGTIYNHLYFVPVIIALYMAYPLLVKLNTKSGLLFALAVSIISQLSELWIDYEIFYMNKNVFNWLFYFILGIWLAHQFEEKTKRVQKYRRLIVVGLVLSMVIVILTPFFLDIYFTYGVALASTRPSVIFYSVMVISFVMVMPWNVRFLNRILMAFSKYSYTIYLAHYLFVSLLWDMYSQWDVQLPSAVYIFLSFILVMIISVGVGLVSQKIERWLTPEKK